MTLIAVLGYSRRGDETLAAICAARLRRAEELAAPGDTVLLSGWGRAAGGTEAELMSAAWAGPEVTLVLDNHARSTAANARSTARHAAELHTREVLLVTSSWHRPRAALLARAALRGSGVALRSAAVPRAWPLLPVLRELACIPVLPLQLLAASRGG